MTQNLEYAKSDHRKFMKVSFHVTYPDEHEALQY